MNDAVSNEAFISGLVVDLMPECRIRDNERLESLLAQFLLHHVDVREARLPSFGGVGHVGCVDQDPVRARLSGELGTPPKAVRRRAAVPRTGWPTPSAGVSRHA